MSPGQRSCGGWNPRRLLLLPPSAPPALGLLPSLSRPSSASRSSSCLCRSSSSSFQERRSRALVSWPDSEQRLFSLCPTETRKVQMFRQRGTRDERSGGQTVGPEPHGDSWERCHDTLREEHVCDHQREEEEDVEVEEKEEEDWNQAQVPSRPSRWKH